MFKIQKCISHTPLLFFLANLTSPHHLIQPIQGQSKMQSYITTEQWTYNILYKAFLNNRGSWPTLTNSQELPQPAQRMYWITLFTAWTNEKNHQENPLHWLFTSQPWMLTSGTTLNPFYCKFACIWHITYFHPTKPAT